MINVPFTQLHRLNFCFLITCTPVYLAFQHWIRLEIQRNILIEQLSIHVEQSDASYMPSLVAVLAGNTIGGLKELKQTSIPSGQREFILVSGLTQVT